MALWQTLIWVIGIICAVWVIYDVWINNKKLNLLIKIIWTALALLIGINIIVATIYYFIGRK
jgi:hypothetical protein